MPLKRFCAYAPLKFERNGLPFLRTNLAFSDDFIKMNSAHTRHNIFKAEPPILKNKKLGSSSALNADEGSVSPPKNDLGAVSITSPKPKGDSKPSHSPSSPKGSLPDIDFNARQKLALKDLSVKFLNKSPSFTVASNYGHPSPESKRHSEYGSPGDINNKLYVYDDDDLSEASHHSVHSNYSDFQKDSRSLMSKAKSKKSIAGNSYFFDENHSIIEVEDEDNYDETEVGEEMSVQQPHPKTFSSTLDAHRSFMKASKARNQLRSTKSIVSNKSIPTDMINAESRKAIVSMKRESSKHHLIASPPNQAKPPSPKSSFYFLTNLTSGRNSPSLEEEKNMKETEEVLGHKAPLESHDRPIIERPLLHSTFSRFKMGKSDENPVGVLRSMESSKQRMQSDLLEEPPNPFKKKDKKVQSQYHIPKLQTQENKSILRTVDSLLQMISFVPAPPKPEPPPPLEKEPLTLQNVLGEHLVKANMKKKVPEEEYQRLLQMAAAKKSPKNAAADDYTINDSASYCTFNSPSPSAPPSPTHHASNLHLPKLDLAPVQNKLDKHGSGSAAHFPSINPHQEAHRKLLHPKYTTENSNMQSYMNFLSSSAQQYLGRFVQPVENKEASKEHIAQKLVEDIVAEPQPLVNPEQEYIYQHSTTSYVPKDYINRSALGYEYTRDHKPREKKQDRDVYSLRHEDNIGRHKAGAGEPVIYLPPNHNGIGLDEDMPILPVPSTNITDILRPGYVLSQPSYLHAHSVLISEDRDHILHYNMFDDEEDDEEEGGGQMYGNREEETKNYRDRHKSNKDERHKEEQDSLDGEGGADELSIGRAGREEEGFINERRNRDNERLPSQFNPPIARNYSSVDEGSFYTNYNLEPNAKYNEEMSVFSEEASMDSIPFGKRSVVNSYLNKPAALLPSIPSELDMRDDIAAFLNTVNSPIKEEYGEYCQKTLASRPQSYQQMNNLLQDDNSSIANDSPSLFYNAPPKDEALPSLPSHLDGTHKKLWKNLQHRYARDNEGTYQTQLKVKAYLKEGIKDNTQIRSKYLEEMEDW